MSEFPLRSAFAAAVGDPFTVSWPDNKGPVLTLVLAEVTGKGQERPFSLIFTGPLQPILPQSIYPLEHPTLGRQEIFIVPIGADASRSGMRYEAVFN